MWTCGRESIFPTLMIFLIKLKVIVSTREHVDRLVAARLQADIMGVDLVIIARTDALDAELLDNNVDIIDQPFILGCTDNKDPLKTGTFVEAGIEAIKKEFVGAQMEVVKKNIYKFIKVS